MAERPIEREKNVSGKGKKIKRRGEGLGTGPVGSGHIGNEEAEGAVKEDIESAAEKAGADGEEGDRDLGDIIQGLNTLGQLTGGGSGNQGSSGLGGLGSLLGGSGGSSNQGQQSDPLGGLGSLLGGSGGSSNQGNQGSSGLGGLGSLLGGSGGGNSGQSSGSSGLGGLGSLLGGGGSGGNGGGGNSGYDSNQSGPLGSGGSSGGGGSKMKWILLLLVLFLVFGGGKGLFSNLLGGGSGGSSNQGSGGSSNTQQSQSTGIDLLQSVLGGGMGSSFSGGNSGSSGSSTNYNGWFGKSNVGVLDESVDKAAKAKLTKIKGDGKDTVTIMVYMCGTDLESRMSMATADLNEMLQSQAGNKVNIIVLTGGCKQWRNNVVSSQVNQIYQIKGGQMVRLESNAGTNAMTDPDYLTKFIQYCAKNFPANRNELILWDHGGGSISGYGYDEKNRRAGSMDLAEIKTALKNSGVTFDFIGFDACLMATVENGLMLSEYADYMIASEESEPGVGWYYTNWLKKLEEDTSMPTLQIGKNICDDFVAACKKSAPRQSTTLSVVDLAELAATAPEKLSAFASDTSKMITATAKPKKDEQTANYKTVTAARTKTREFARGQGIDQVDVIHLAKNLDTKYSNALAKSLLSAVKYNQASSDMTNSFGLSIYFPYQRMKNVDTIAKVYDQIGMSDDYTKCIKQYAKVETGGQSAYGGSAMSSPMGSLFELLQGAGSQSYSAPSSSVSSGDVTDLLGALLGGRSNIDELNESNTEYLKEESLSNEDVGDFVSANYFDESQLSWEKDGDDYKIHLSDDQWSLVTDLELNMYYDDGEGFIELGFDNIFKLTDKGDLIGNNDHTWLAVDEQPVAYYYESTVGDKKDYTVRGHIPVLLNGERANLIVVFTDEEPNGRIEGAQFVYDDEVEVVAKNVTELKEGDTIDFIADYFTYNAEYQDSYMIGDQYVVGKEAPKLSYVEMDEDTWAMYRFTDIYNQQHYSEIIPK